MITEDSIPAGWEMKQVGDVANVEYGDSLPKKDRNEGTVPVYGSGGVSSYHDEASKTGPAIILGRKGSVNNVSFVTGPFCSIDTTFVVTVGDQVLPRYLYYFFESYDLESLDASAAIPSLRKGDVVEIEVPLPPVEEQERIVATLDTAFDALDTVDELQAWFDEQSGEFVDSVLHHAFNPCPDNKNNTPDHWEIETVSDVGEVITGGTPRRSEDSYYGGDIPWLRISDIDGRYVEDSDEYLTEKGLDAGTATLLEPGAVILSTRATIGEVAIAADPVSTNQGFKSVEPDRETVLPEYLAYYFTSIKNELERLGRGATYAEVNKSQLADVEVPIPPITEQNQIVSMLDDAFAVFDSLDVLDSQFTDRQNELRETILHHAFKGEIQDSGVDENIRDVTTPTT